MSAAICGIFVLVPLLLQAGLHAVPEGHIGIYFRGGALIEGTTEPGWHYMMPLVTRMEPVQVTL